jgi:hypothetical protein
LIKDKIEAAATENYLTNEETIIEKTYYCENLPIPSLPKRGNSSLL